IPPGSTGGPGGGSPSTTSGCSRSRSFVRSTGSASGSSAAFQEATRRKAVTGEELLRLLETRLDSLVLRLGFAQTVRQARQFVSHGHFQVNGRRIDIPTAQVAVGQAIEATPAAKNFLSVHEALAQGPKQWPPARNAGAPHA